MTADDILRLAERNWTYADEWHTFAAAVRELYAERDALIHDNKRHITIANAYLLDAERYQFIKANCEVQWPSEDGSADYIEDEAELDAAIAQARK